MGEAGVSRAKSSSCVQEKGPGEVAGPIPGMKNAFMDAIKAKQGGVIDVRCLVRLRRPDAS